MLFFFLTISKYSARQFFGVFLCRNYSQCGVWNACGFPFLKTPGLVFSLAKEFHFALVLLFSESATKTEEKLTELVPRIGQITTDLGRRGGTISPRQDIFI